MIDGIALITINRPDKLNAMNILRYLLFLLISFFAIVSFSYCIYHLEQHIYSIALWNRKNMGWYPRRPRSKGNLIISHWKVDLKRSIIGSSSNWCRKCIQCWWWLWYGYWYPCDSLLFIYMEFDLQNKWLAAMINLLECLRTPRS